MNAEHGRTICTPMFIATLFTTIKIWKQLSVDQQMNGYRICQYVIYMYVCVYIYIYIYIYIYSAMRKKEILPFMTTTWMDLEWIMLSEIFQTEKYKYCIMSLKFGI